MPISAISPFQARAISKAKMHYSTEDIARYSASSVLDLDTCTTYLYIIFPHSNLFSNKKKLD
jgi:hypothetical protein